LHSCQFNWSKTLCGLVKNTENQSIVDDLASQVYLWLSELISLPLQQKFLIGVSAAFFLDVSQQSKTEHGSGHEMKYAYLCHRVSARGHFNTTNKK